MGNIKFIANSIDAIRLELATFWFVAQCLNQLRHRVPHINTVYLNQSHYRPVYALWVPGG